MARKVFAIFLALLVSALLSSPVLAQVQTGSLFGTITDQNGEPLPGCTLTLSSPALMGKSTFVSSEEGKFRFPTLPPGIYALTTEMPGFKKITLEGIIINVGKTTTITVTMEQSAIEEEITVTTEAPIVDIKSTKKSITYTANLLENIPIGRSMAAVIASAPGSIGPVSHGGHGAANRYYLDGVDMTNPGTGGPMTELSYDLYDEVEIQTGAHPADVGNIPGAYINIVSKSGGNEFHGQVNVYYFNESFVDKNFSKEQLDTLKISSAGEDKDRIDVSATLGGPIFKDKFWFFVSGRYLDSTSLVTGFPLDYTRDETYGFGKLTFQARKNIKFVGYFNYVDMNTPYTGASPTRSPEACSIFDDTSKVVNLQVNWILSQNAFLDIRGMYVNRPLGRYTRPDATWPNQDRGTGMVTGSYRWDDIYTQGRNAIMPSFTLFLDNFLGGYHELKIGGEYEKGYSHMDIWMKTPITTYTWSGSPYWFGNYRGQFAAHGYGNTKGSGKKIFDMYKYALYVQDNLTIQDRLTLNLGVRYWSASGTCPAQIYPEVPYWTWLNPVFFAEMKLPALDELIVFKGFSPRLGLSFDIFGNKKTIVKASFSHDYDYMMNTFHAAYRAISYINYSWTDTNQNGKIDAADLITERNRFGRDKNPKEQYDPNIKAPWWDEFIIGIDHELLANFRVAVSYISKLNRDVYYSTEKDNKENWATPYTVTDPGYDGKFGTEDDAKLTIFDRTKPFEGYFYTNPPEAWRKYRGLEFVFEKRMSNKWQLLGSIVYSKTWGTIGAASDPTGNEFDTPNYLINREGRTDYDRPLVIKMQGTYQLPSGLNFSASFLHSSGSPFTREVNVYAPKYGAYVAVNAEPQASRRGPSYNNLDLRLEKGFVLGNFGRLGLWIDAFNALNSTYVYVRSSAHGAIEQNGSFTPNPLWHTVSSVSSPRVIRLGARFSF